jgi:hypothetical protein
LGKRRLFGLRGGSGKSRRSHVDVIRRRCLLESRRRRREGGGRGRRSFGLGEGERKLLVMLLLIGRRGCHPDRSEQIRVND